MTRQLACNFPDAASRVLSAPWPSAGGYSTSFPLDQNPIVEDGGWLNGLANAGDWLDMQTVGGVLCATGFNDTSQNDSIALRLGIHTTRHYAQGTVFLQAGYAPGNGHEIELFVGGTMTFGSIFGFEILFSLFGSFQIARWLGARSNGVDTGITVNNFNGGPAQPVHGMVCRAQYSISGLNVFLEIFQNGVKVADATIVNPGSVYLSGRPGGASFVRSGAGASLTGMGWMNMSFGTY